MSQGNDHMNSGGHDRKEKKKQTQEIFIQSTSIYLE